MNDAPNGSPLSSTPARSPASASIAASAVMADTPLLCAVVQLGPGPARQLRVLPAQAQVVEELADGVRLGLPAGPAHHLVRGDEPLEVVRRQVAVGQEAAQLGVLLEVPAGPELGDGAVQPGPVDRHALTPGRPGRE